MKHLITVLAVLVLLGTVAGGTAAADRTGEFAILVGNESVAWLDLPLGKSWELNAYYEEEALRLGLGWQISKSIELKLGSNYNLDQEQTTGYGCLEYELPFGNNLQVNAFYNYNYQGEEWSNYEAAVRIQIYEHQYLWAGVRGETGDGAPVYRYNPDQEALLFLRGDLNWEWTKFSIQLRPNLHIKGSFFHNYDLRYKLGEQTALLFNFNTLYDYDSEYRLGLQVTF